MVPGTAPVGLGGVAGLMGTLGTGNSMGMSGIVGALNGVIQAPTGTTSPLTTGITLPVNRCVLTTAGTVGGLVQSVSHSHGRNIIAGNKSS